MTLRSFIDAAYTLLVEECQRLGMDLWTALEKISQLGMPAEIEVAADVPQIDNAESINQLMSMMGGVKGAPV